MTSEPILDRRLRELMAELAAPGDTSAAIDHVLSVTRPLRPEPRWLVFLKEPPMRTSSVLVAGSPPMRTGLILAIIAILVAAAATVAVGALVFRPAPLPLAYGPAGNGVMAAAVNGDIVTVDQSGSQVARITTGPAVDSRPIFSRDGSRIAFVRSDPGGTTQRLMVARGDGTGLLAASPELIEVQAYDWSPSGDQLALLGDIRMGLTPSVFVAAADGSAWSELDLGDLDPRDWVAWRPPAGDELVVRAHPASGDAAVALYAVSPDGGGVRRLVDPALAEGVDAAAVFAPELSPDGRWATFWTWGPNEAGAINGWGHVLDLETGAERIATAWGGSPSPITPDGRSVVGVSDRLVIEPLDGSAAAHDVGPAVDPNGVQVALSPDGTRILVTEASGARKLVDIATGKATPLDVATADSLSWQRIALP